MKKSLSTIAVVLCFGSVSLASRGASAQPSVELSMIASTADQITYIANSGVDGDDRVFVVRKRGIVQIISGGALVSTPFLNIDAAVRDPGGIGDERGLLSMAFHPDYATNGYLYVSYNDNGGDSVIERYTVSAGDPDVADVGSARVVLTQNQPAGNHNGGQIQFGDDGYLYIGFGDGGGGCDSAGSGCNAQKTNSWLGSLLRVDVDGDDFPADDNRNYAVPGDNPFVADAGVLDEIWAYGLRNPWRFSFDRGTGDLWIGDVGQSGGSRREEVDHQPAGTGGQNYGWPFAEGTTCGPGTCPTGACPSPTPSCASFTDPVYEYGGGATCAITGGFVYRGAAIPGLVGRYIFADYCEGRVLALEVGTTNAPEIANGGGGLTSFGEDVRGEIYLAVNDNVYKIVPVVETCSNPGDCASGFCVDGFCCDAACTGDCEACSVASGSPADGVCLPLSSSVMCRDGTGSCDPAETCDGTSSMCPPDSFAPDGTDCDGTGMCSAGACVPRTDGGPPPSDGGGPRTDSGTPRTDGGTPPPPRDDGCGCHTAGHEAPAPWWLLLVAVPFVLRRRVR